MFIMVAPSMIPLAVMFFIFWRNPEARTFVTAWIKGGVIISDADDSGQIEFKRAVPLGEGQYMSGKDKFGVRKLYVYTRINNPLSAKRFFLSGIHVPLFDHYGGKVALATKSTLAAIEVAETENKEELPENIKAFAKEHALEIRKRDEPTEKKSNGKGLVGKLLARFANQGIEKVNLFAMDVRKLRFYFSDSYDESQVDVLLERARQTGFEEGRGGKGLNQLVMVVVIMGVVGMIALIALKGLGVF